MMDKSRRATAALLIPATLILAAGVQAQFNAPKFLRAVPTALKPVQAGKAFTLSVTVSIDTPYHIQGNPSKEGYIATEMEVGPLKGFKVEKVTYPKPTITSMAGEKLPVYAGKVNIKADVTSDKELKPGKYMLPVTLKYQGCDEQKCFPPTTLNTKATITVTPGARTK